MQEKLNGLMECMSSVNRKNLEAAIEIERKSIEKAAKSEQLKIDLLELYTLVNYTSSCGIPITMDMLYFYFGDSIENYEDILYALKKMNKIIVETADKELQIDDSQNYLMMRSKLFAERSINLIPADVFAHVLNEFLDRVSPHIIYRYDIFKKA